MKITKSIFSCGMALALTAGVVNAQDTPDESAQLPIWMENVYLGGSIGATTAITDVKQYDLYPVQKYRNEIGFGGGGYIGYTINSAFSVEGQIYGIGINGVKRQDYEWFTGGILEPSLNLKVNFTNLFFTGTKSQTKLSLHGYAGAGIAMFRSRLFRLGEGDIELDPINRVEGYDLNQEKLDRTQEISIPFGFQIGYELAPQVGLVLDQRVGFVNTDKLDATLTGNEAGEFYTYTAIGLNFKLSDKKWVRPESEMLDKLAQVDSILEGFKDTDQDGVMDTYDKDNQTPAGAKTTGDGMAMDTDGDGVADYVDQERLSVCTEVDENGVALDSDGDNVPDCKDTEPNTEEGAQVDITGKTISAVAGLPATTESGADVGLPSIYFSTGSTKLGYSNYPALTEVAKFLKANKDAKLTVVGHTDATGPKEFNQKLGKRRAQAAIDHLVKIYGIDAGRLTAVSEGSNNGIALSNAARANRRVDFLFAK
jgi:outer membrane protein OmpA-like peptidoglycan-associated protein